MASKRLAGGAWPQQQSHRRWPSDQGEHREDGGQNEWAAAVRPSGGQPLNERSVAPRALVVLTDQTRPWMPPAARARTAQGSAQRRQGGASPSGADFCLLGEQICAFPCPSPSSPVFRTLYIHHTTHPPIHSPFCLLSQIQIDAHSSRCLPRHQLHVIIAAPASS
jgi:hypothetical protein